MTFQFSLSLSMNMALLTCLRCQGATNTWTFALDKIRQQLLLVLSDSSSAHKISILVSILDFHFVWENLFCTCLCCNSFWVRKPGTRACWKPFRQMTETWPSVPSATPQALTQLVPFHLNFDYETAPAEVPHKKGIIRFAPPRLQQIRPTYFSSWEENWSFPDSVCTHPEKEKPRSGKKRTTLTSNGSPTYLSSLLKGSSWRELRGGGNLTRR